MYNYVNNIEEIWRYTEVLALHTGAKTLHWEDNKKGIHVVEYKIVTPMV